MNNLVKMIGIIIVCVLVLLLVPLPSAGIWFFLLLLGLTMVTLACSMYVMRWIFRP